MRRCCLDIAHCFTLLSEPRSEKGRREVKFAYPSNFGAAARATAPKYRGGHLAAVAPALTARSILYSTRLASAY
jgi:hypothetical protein